MHKIFVGMLLIFLNFNLQIGNLYIEFIPDFIGYIFMLKGLQEIKELSNWFSKVMPFVKATIAYSMIIYILQLFGINFLVSNYVPLNLIDLLLLALAVIVGLVDIFISYNIIMGIRDIEDVWKKDLNFGRLYSIWQIQLFVWISVNILILASLIFLDIIVIFAAIFSVIALVLQVYNLYAFNKTRIAFYTYNNNLL